MLTALPDTATAPWTLWPFQGEGVDRIEHELKTSRRVLAASPTGSGKTVMAMELIFRAFQRGETSMFLAPRRELLKQTAAKLDQWLPFGYGMIQASEKGQQNLYLPIQVASVDTLVSRVIKRQRLVLPPVKNVFLDEAHLYMTAHRKALIELFPDSRIVGLTATPGRHDGRALNIGFDRLIEITTVKKLTREGFLVPAYYRAPSRPDLEKIKIVAGEYNQREVSERMEPLLGGIVESWLKWEGDRRTAVFAPSVGQSIYLADEFRKHGVAAEHCDGTAEANYRDALFSRFRSGETQVLCNVDLATYGFDLPAISCIVLARPTLSVVRYLQMIGRGLRIDTGKKDCAVHDHSGAIYQHGKADEDRHWSLAGIKSVTRIKTGGRTGTRVKTASHLRCPKCTLVFEGSLTCPNCAYYFERAAKKFHVVDGDIVPISDPGRDKSLLEQRIFYGELLGYCREVGYKPGWASFCYGRKFKGQNIGTDWYRDKPLVPSEKTRRWIQHMFIRQARSRKKSASS